MRLIANARMYGATPEAAALWRRLFDWTAEQTGIALEPVNHRPPAPLSALWARPDMGLVQMCGWPYDQASPRPLAVAAPVPDGDEDGDQPVYRSDMIVRADGPIHRLEDAFGGAIAWTVEDSHSGYNAPRRLLAAYANRAPLFARAVGPVVSPRGAIDAVLSGAADIAPLDGYFHRLLKRFEPETAARLRVVSRTEPAPIPLFVASPTVPADMVEALRDALLGADRDAKAAEILAGLALRRFAAVAPERYALAERWRREAEAAGYPRIA